VTSAEETLMTWEEILEETLRIEDDWRSGGLAVWYRGHADAGWELKSTLHRHVERFMKAMRPAPATSAWREQLREEYKTQYRRFRADAWPLLDLRELSDWGIVFAMQHYGQLTRLWTGRRASRAPCTSPSSGHALVASVV
jgi:FRG domain